MKGTVMKFKTELEKLDWNMTQSYNKMARQWQASAPGPMAEQAGRIAVARLLVKNLADTITEADAAFLLQQYDDPLQRLTDTWLEKHMTKSLSKDIVACINSLSYKEGLKDENITVEEFIAQHPSASFDFFTPFGYVRLSAEQAQELVLNRGSYSANPGCSGSEMEFEAFELLGQVISKMQIEQGVWYLMTDYPEPEQAQGIILQ